MYFTNPGALTITSWTPNFRPPQSSYIHIPEPFSIFALGELNSLDIYLPRRRGTLYRTEETGNGTAVEMVNASVLGLCQAGCSAISPPSHGLAQSYHLYYVLEKCLVSKKSQKYFYIWGRAVHNYILLSHPNLSHQRIWRDNIKR